MPLELDDEYIFPTMTLPPPPNEVPLVAGFNSLIRIYMCFIALPDDATTKTKLYRAYSNESPNDARNQSLRDVSEALRRMFERVRYVLDTISSRLAPWQHGSAEGSSNNATNDDAQTKSDQLESIRANLHVTQLWARSLIFERLSTATTTSSSNSNELNLWSERENSCEQLLHILYNMKRKSLEPNGISLTLKIRQVAAPLLDCPFEEHTSISRRARLYIEKFMELLTLMDKYSFQDTQMVAWNAFERQARWPVEEFMEDT